MYPNPVVQVSQPRSLRSPSEPSETSKTLVISDDAAFSALFETISVSSPEVIDDILRKNPQVVNSQVYHGLSLLHKACMRGDPKVLAVILNHGADPNIRTVAEETPLHYACRRGQLPLVATLLDRGANVAVLDSTGHNCMHYAAQGGAIAVLAYLNEVHHLEYNITSHAVQTPLHVAALHGHWATTVFLLRKQRCQVDLADVMGNTPLHLAAMCGHVSICWQLISAHRGANCLTMTNGQNQKPVDMTAAQVTFRHKETQMWLRKFTEQHSSSGYFSTGNLQYVFCLLFPLVLCCVLPIIADWLLNDIQPFVCVLVLFVFSQWLMRQNHRLSHPSRLPNPARAGVFLWGLISDLICYFYYLQPYYVVHWLLNWISWTGIFCVFASLIGFFVADPGRYTREEVAGNSNGPGRNWDIMKQGVMGVNFCDECELIQAPYVRHCRMCHSCFRNMQHHCLFLLRCVTAANAKYFLMFLSGVTICCVAYIVNFAVLLNSGAGGPAAVYLWQMVKKETLVIVMVFVNLMGMCWCGILIRHQLQELRVWRNRGDHQHSHDFSV